MSKFFSKMIGVTDSVVAPEFSYSYCAYDVEECSNWGYTATYYCDSYRGCELWHCLCSY